MPDDKQVLKTAQRMSMLFSFIILVVLILVFIILYAAGWYTQKEDLTRKQCINVCSDVEFAEQSSREKIQTVATHIGSVLRRSNMEFLCSTVIVSSDRIVVPSDCIEGLDLRDIAVRTGSYYRNYGGSIHVVDSIEFVIDARTCLDNNIKVSCPKSFLARQLKITPAQEKVGSITKGKMAFVPSGEEGVVSFNRHSKKNPYAKYMMGFSKIEDSRSCDPTYFTRCTRARLPKGNSKMDLGGAIVTKTDKLSIRGIVVDVKDRIYKFHELRHLNVRN